MKVAVNKCWGGFGISHKATLRYAELKGIKLYASVDKRDKNGNINLRHLEEYKNQKDPFIIHYSTKPLENGAIVEGSYWSCRDIERNDPLLIQVIEELGAEANGDFARLEVIEIPDDVEYEIDDYDGMESIHEKHRSW